MGIFSKKNKQDNKSTWTPPLQKHVDSNGIVQWITIRTRLYAGNVEQDYNFKFQPGQVLASTLKRAVCARLEIPLDSQNEFSIWIIGRDLELQLKNETDVFDFVKNWHLWMSKYTHIPESLEAGSPVNRYIFVFKLSILNSISIENDICVKLIYGETRNNLLSERLLPTLKDVLRLGGLELQVIANYDETKYPAFLSGSKWTGLVPKSIQHKMTSEEWVVAFQSQHALHKDLDGTSARRLYVQYAQILPLFGCAFFPCCKEIPPAGLFEVRLETFMVAINGTQLHVIDKTLKINLLSVNLESTVFHYEKNKIEASYKENTRDKTWQILSPQAYLIMNVISKVSRQLFKQGKISVDKMMKKQQVVKINRNSNGFFGDMAQKAMRQNSMLAAQRVSMAHHQAIQQIYGEESIQMIGKATVPNA